MMPFHSFRTSGPMLLVAMAAALVIPGTLACSGSKFGSQRGTKKSSSSEDSNPGPGSGGPQGQGAAGLNTHGRQGFGNQGLVANPLEGTVFSAQEMDPCRGAFGNQTILILDLKSGWFAGDGGTFFEERIDPNCPGQSNLNIHYYHVTQAIIETNRNPADLHDQSQQQVPSGQREALACSVPFKSSSSDRLYRDASPQNACALNRLDRFSQIWLLSGDAADDLDITSSSPLFLSILDAIEERVAQKPVGIFLGAGLGNTTHSNAVAETILGQRVFTGNPMTHAGVFPSTRFVSFFESEPMSAATGPSVPKGSFRASFSAFSGLASLFDYGGLSPMGEIAARLAPSRSNANTIFEMIPRCFADPIVHPELTIIARDRCDQGAVGFLEKPGLRLYAEGNMARFYGMDDPRGLVARIARTLALDSK